MNTEHPSTRPGHRPRRDTAALPNAEPAAQRPVARRPQGADVRVRILGVGSMAVGSVEAMGAHSVGFARGDRVAFPLNREERAVLTAEDEAGGMGSVVVSAERLLGVPRDVGTEQAARLLAPGLVTRVLLRQLRPIRTGDGVRVDLEPGVVRAVVAAWATALGATLDDGSSPVDVILDEESLREAHAIAFRRGHLQVGSADVFAAIRDGVFDDVLDTVATGRQAAA
ncbi:hypothetical protein ACFFGH_30610 [Lysobacter korlensis]|uniref:Uncharacterized protein n=1 Tax=Lysobacter korlensis TaxID=553636 RepID=A0ABV6RYZ9_9GAMM